MPSQVLLGARCPKCGGRLYLDTYEKPPDIACVNCGWRKVYQTEEETEDVDKG